MMPKSVRTALNQEREKMGKEMFANTRNATAGSVKLLDSGEVAKRELVCFVYDMLSAKNAEGEEISCNLSDYHFPGVKLNKKPAMMHEIVEICLDHTTKQFLDSQDFDFDGLVIKVIDQPEQPDIKDNLFENGENNSEFPISFRQILGATHHHPRWGMAYKFPAEQASTQILSIDFQVGRSGIITPVANVSPVQLSGAEISRVSLHNFDFIHSKDIKEKDFVRIQRSGEVIPYIMSVIKERRTGEENLVTPPLFCPSCNAPITNIDIHYYCTNPSCSAQLREKILHFVSKDAMDIQGIGDSIVDVLIQQHILETIVDIYKILDLPVQILLKKYPGFGEKRV